MLKQTKGLNAINRKQYRQALLQKGTKLIDPENETIHEDITLTRPSAKIVWNGTSFVEVPANEPAWNVDFETGEKRLLVDGEATNLNEYSHNLTMFQTAAPESVTIETSDADNIIDPSIKAMSLTFTGVTYVSTNLFSGIPDGNYRVILIGETVSNTRLGFYVRGRNKHISVNTSDLSLVVDDIGLGYEVFALNENTILLSAIVDWRAGETIAIHPGFGLGGLGKSAIIHHLGFYTDVTNVSPIATTGAAVTRAEDTITSAHTTTGTQLISSDGKFDATNDVSKVLPETGAISSYTVFDKDLTAQALTRFKSDEVFEDAP